MPAQSGIQTAGHRIPQPNHPVRGATGQCRVTEIRHGQDSRLRGEGGLHLARGRIPQLDRAIQATDGQGPAVRGESRGGGLFLPCEHRGLDPGHGIVDPDAEAAGHRQPRPVGRVDNGSGPWVENSS